MAQALFRKLKDTTYAFTDNELVDLRKSLENFLDEISLLHELDTDNPYRIRAYRRAKGRLYRHEGQLPELIRTKALRSIDGIGDSISQQIQDFVFHEGAPPGLAALRLTFPSFLIELLADQTLRASLLKIYKVYPIQSAEELLILLDTRIFGSLLPIPEGDLKELLQKLVSPLSTENSNIATLPRLKGAGTYVQDPKLLLKDDEDFISALSWLLYGGSPLPTHSDQARIRHQFHLKRPRLCADFIDEIKESLNPVVDFLRYPGLFQPSLILEASFLELCQEQQKIFMIPLHPLLRSSITQLVAKIKDFKIGVLFGLAMPGLGVQLLQELGYLHNQIGLDPRKIFNFQPAEVLLRHLLKTRQ